MELLITYSAHAQYSHRWYGLRNRDWKCLSIYWQSVLRDVHAHIYLSLANFMHGGGHYRTKNSVSTKQCVYLQAFPQTMFSTTPITYQKL